MGSAVSTGVNNDDLVNNLVKENYITSHAVEQVFRAVDRGHFVDGNNDNEDRDPNDIENGAEGDTRRARMPRRRRSTSAYEDLAWREGNLHLSAPCIYTHVMEELDLRPGLSFLNIGSGTGYLNLMVGHIIGPTGCNHGVEIHQECIDYANERIVAYVRSGPHFDKYNIGLPQFFRGNGMCLSSDCFFRYDRVYCGAAVPSEHIQFMKQLVKPGGVLVLPCGDQLVKITVKDDYSADLRDLLPVSFASLIVPSQTELKNDTISLPLKSVPSLKQLCRITIREQIRSCLFPPDTTKVPAMPLTKAERAQKRRMTRGTRSRRRRARPVLVPAVQDNQSSTDTRQVSSNENDRSDVNVSSSAEHTVGAIDNEDYIVPQILPEEIAIGIAENIANDILNEAETSNDEGTPDLTDAQSAQPANQNQNLDFCEPSRSQEEPSGSEVEANDELDSSNDSLRKGFKGIAVNNDGQSNSETKGSINPQTKMPEFLFNCIGTDAIVDQTDNSTEQTNSAAKKVLSEDTSNSSEASPSSSLPKQPKRMRIASVKDKPQSSTHEKVDGPTSSKDANVVNKSCSDQQTDSEKDCPKGLSDSSVGRVTTSEESEDGPNSTTEDSQGSLVDVVGRDRAESRVTATRNLLFPESTAAVGTTESLDVRETQTRNEEDETEETQITPVSLPFPIRFFLEMQNHVRTLDIDDIMSNPRRSLDVLEGGAGGRSSGESRGGGATSPGTSRDPGDETYLEADSENEDDEDEDSGLSGDNLEGGGASVYTLATSKMAWPKTTSEETKSSKSADKDKNEGRPHPSVFWMRESINKLDLPQFLIDYLLYNRKYNFD